MTLSTEKKLQLEFILIFILFPILLSLKIIIWIKGLLSVIGFLYIVRVLLANKYTFFKTNTSQVKGVLKKVAFLFLCLIIITISYLYFTEPDKLFIVLLKNPKLWLGILAGYSILSVIPQEIIYRSFYFERYQKLFSNKNTLLLSNAAVFSLGHLFFQNPLVLAITFVGGFIFAYTYYKTKSLLLVTIEHIIYGCWLFTVGMGDMLGFPTG